MIPRIVWLAIGFFGPMALKWIWGHILEVPSYVEDIKKKQELDNLKLKEQEVQLRKFMSGESSDVPNISWDLFCTLTQEDVKLINKRLGEESKKLSIGGVKII